MQETFTSVWRSARTYKPERGPGAPWLSPSRGTRSSTARGARRPRRRGLGRALLGRGPARARRAELDGLARPPRAWRSSRTASGSCSSSRTGAALAERDRRGCASRSAPSRRARAAGCTGSRIFSRESSREAPDFDELVGDVPAEDASGCAARTTSSSPPGPRPSCRADRAPPVRALSRAGASPRCCSRPRSQPAFAAGWLLRVTRTSSRCAGRCRCTRRRRRRRVAG